MRKAQTVVMVAKQHFATWSMSKLAAEPAGDSGSGSGSRTRFGLSTSASFPQFNTDSRYGSSRSESSVSVSERVVSESLDELDLAESCSSLEIDWCEEAEENSISIYDSGKFDLLIFKRSTLCEFLVTNHSR